MSKPRRTDWHGAAKWYDKLVGDQGSDYQQNLIIPGSIKLLAPKPGEKILDLACGQGVFCRELAKSGAEVIGIDNAKGLIKAARQRSPRIKFFLADAENLDLFPAAAFDAVSCLMAIQNIESHRSAIAEMGRVLKPKGRGLIVMSHPAFRVPKQSGWGFDEQKGVQYRRVDSYMSELRSPIQLQPGYAPNLYTWTFHRPLSSYIQALAAAGLAVTALEEWLSHRQSKPGKNAQAENRARQEIPLFLALLAYKK